MNEDPKDTHRQRQLYWNELTALKGAACYMSRYRDRLGRWVVALGMLKAIASCGSIAAWAIWKEYSFLWGLIIALSQVADALRDVFPFAKKQKAASDYASALNSLFIDAQLEWDVICANSRTPAEMMNHLHSLRKLQLEAERQSFPSGVAADESLRLVAKQDAENYLKSTYGVS